MSILLVGALILVVAIDGVMCLIMAFPLSALLAVLGTVLGRAIGSSCGGGPGKWAAPVVLLAFPGLVAFESTAGPEVLMREITTRVVVDAPIQDVWKTVVAFPKITEPPTGIFKCGIAYPIEARIDGSGVGAVRHCIFSTGPFVEPITRWEEPTRLSFDVEKSPAPMEELSFYDHIDAPHLHGHMVSHRGEFRLIEQDGKVVLEGTTWYTHTLAPQWYWGPISDYLIHRIHERVLTHIQRVAEGK
jgi:hypothetical protein